MIGPEVIETIDTICQSTVGKTAEIAIFAGFFARSCQIIYRRHNNNYQERHTSSEGGIHTIMKYFYELISGRPY